MGMTCWEQLGMLIALEHDDADLASEHFLTVASYNIQHPAQFMDDVLVGLRQSLGEYLDRTVTIAELRQRTGKTYAGNTRVLRPVEERQPMLRSWSMTIADVYLPDQPAEAADRVRAWGASIRREM